MSATAASKLYELARLEPMHTSEKVQRKQKKHLVHVREPKTWGQSHPVSSSCVETSLESKI